MVWLYHQEEVSILPSEAEEAEPTLYQANGYIDTEIEPLILCSIYICLSGYPFYSAYWIRPLKAPLKRGASPPS